MYLNGLATYLGQTRDVCVVGMAATPGQALDRLRADPPDVALLNVDMLGIVQDVPDVVIVAVSDLDKEEHLGAAMAAGAGAYLTKNAEPEDVLTAIRVAARGGFFTNAAVAPRIRRMLSPGTAFPQLTAREREVLDLLAQDTGLTAIAGSLGVTSKTVGRHVSNICLKLPARSQADAIRIARAARIHSRQ